MTKIIFITGASGSGKTTVAKYLAEKYQVYNFDDIGVPTIEEMIAKYGSREGWQEWATKSWMERLSELEGDEVVILEGSFNPGFLFKSIECSGVIPVKTGIHTNGKIDSRLRGNDKLELICLHADRVTREKRLIKHRNQPELVTQDMENFANVLKQKTLTLGGTVVDSSGDIHDTIKACLLAIEGKDSLRIEVPTLVARRLIEEQFPQYSHLEIKPVNYSGWDNATFHLGDEMLLRIPRGASYALKVPKEQALLSKLGEHLSIPIPKPIALGRPSNDYPFNWSIYKYLEGDSANTIELTDQDLEQIAYDLALFLKELHQIDTKNAPLPGLHNYWRGEHFTVYECGALKYFEKLKDVINTDKAIKIWEKASSTKWEKPPVWIHGDLAPGNILVSETARSESDKAVQKNREIMDCRVEDKFSPRNYGLRAVIDFGGCAIGDPACDLAIAYTFFKGKSREIFKQELALDESTWLRAKAWVLWKISYELTHIEDKSSTKAMEQIRIFNEVMKSHL
jgi:aminoglycoside phosphotransferase (APT) family kinase protein